MLRFLHICRSRRLLIPRHLFFFLFDYLIVKIEVFQFVSSIGPVKFGNLLKRMLWLGEVTLSVQKLGALLKLGKHKQKHHKWTGSCGSLQVDPVLAYFLVINWYDHDYSRVKYRVDIYEGLTPLRSNDFHGIVIHHDTFAGECKTKQELHEVGDVEAICSHCAQLGNQLNHNCWVDEGQSTNAVSKSRDECYRDKHANEKGRAKEPKLCSWLAHKSELGHPVLEVFWLRFDGSIHVWRHILSTDFVMCAWFPGKVLLI